MLLRASLVSIVLLAACGDDGGEPDGGLCRVGDPSAVAELQVVVRGPDGALRELADGDTLALEIPPQGGEVAFVGVRARNVDVCGASIQAALRDPCTNRVIGIEQRPVTWRLASDGFAEPAQPTEISDFANVPACPNAATAHDVDGNPLELEVRLYEASGRTTERTLTVTPVCDSDYCRCQCDSDYDLGAECPSDPDGGVECPPDAGV